MPARSNPLSRFVQKGAFFQSVVEDGSDIVFVVDYDGIIFYHNNSVKENLGYAKEGLIGKNFLEYIREEVAESVRKAFQASTRRAFNRAVEFQFRCKDGTYRFFEFNSVNLKQAEGVEGLILDCRDITQRKKDAAELLLAQQAREQFMANISHEIRTPINGIAGIASLLDESTPKEQLKTYLNAIRAASENLKVIINDILDISRIESGKLRLEKIGFNLEDLLTSLESTFDYQTRSRGLTLTFQQDAATRKIYFGDPVRLNQILINLIGNALKFTQQGSITVRISSDRKKDLLDYLRFEVRDTGIGIAQDKINLIFERFSQADSSVTRKFGGTGLGLTIVKQLAELQGGTISVNSVEGLGSVFTVIIPYDTQGAELTPKVPVKSTTPSRRIDLSAKQLRVLLVEDNDINQLYASSILKGKGATVEVAENGFIALEKLKSSRPGLILMDIQMPVMDGFEASRAIRSGPEATRNIPIIALTANTTQNIIQKCMACGMNDYLPKPFSPEDLERVLTEYAFETPLPLVTTPDASPVDLSYLERVSSNDREFIRQIVDSFLENATKTIDVLRQAIDEKDRKTIERGVHKLKPALAMIGAEACRAKAAAIEDWATGSESTVTLMEETARFIDLVEQIKERLRSLTATQS